MFSGSIERDQWHEMVNRCYLINCNHYFLKKIIIGLSSVIKIWVLRKIYTSQSFLEKLSRVILEKAEFNMFLRDSFNPRNIFYTKNELMNRQSYMINALLGNFL